MDLDKVRELLDIVAQSGVSEVEVEEDEFRLVVRKNAPSIMMQQPGGMPFYGGGYAPAPQGPPPPQQGAAQQQPAQQQAAPQQTKSSAPAAPEPAETQDGAPSPAEEEGEVGAGENEELIRAPIVGTFYRRPSPDDDPYVNVGDPVSKGEVVCIIEAMKIMNEIECETSGTIKEILVEDAEPVEFDQPLFVVETS